ncbi:MAG TPA: hypothetical protein H9936_00340 [Candidatus Agathobaculum intestinigallinarum]|nr:hypothetical protein [Candidatus Agathobaculum intestinigallinarum]
MANRLPASILHDFFTQSLRRRRAYHGKSPLGGDFHKKPGRAPGFLCPSSAPQARVPRREAALYEIHGFAVSASRYQRAYHRKSPSGGDFHKKPGRAPGFLYHDPAPLGRVRGYRAAVSPEPLPVSRGYGYPLDCGIKKAPISKKSALLHQDAIKISR